MTTVKTNRRKNKKSKKDKANVVTSKEEKGEESPDEKVAKGKQVKAQEEDLSSEEEDECEKNFANQCIATEEEKRTYMRSFPLRSLAGREEEEGRLGRVPNL